MLHPPPQLAVWGIAKCVAFRGLWDIIYHLIYVLRVKGIRVYRGIEGHTVGYKDIKGTKGIMGIGV